MKKSINGLKNQLDNKKVLVSAQTSSIVGGNDPEEIRRGICCIMP